VAGERKIIPRKGSSATREYFSTFYIGGPFGLPVRGAESKKEMLPSRDESLRNTRLTLGRQFCIHFVGKILPPREELIDFKTRQRLA
jgi:hypothetical protein